MNILTEINKNIQEQDVELVNDKKFIFMVCSKCGWAGIASTPSKWVQLFKKKLTERKLLSRPKCPFCK